MSGPGHGATRYAARNQRGGAGVRVLLVLLLVAVLGGVVLGDGYFRQRVEQGTADNLQTQLGTPQPPEVTIDGTPFSTQILVGSIGAVRVVADQVGQTTEARLTVAHADLTATDVTSDDWFATMRLGHVEGDARVDYSVVASLAGVPVVYAGNGRVEMTVTSTVVDQQINARITGIPALKVGNQTLTLEKPEIEVAGVGLPDFTSEALLKLLLKPIPVDGLPLGLTLSAVTASDDGLHGTVVGDDIATSR